MREFKLIYQKPGFVIAPTDTAGVFTCIWMKSNARYRQGAVTPNIIHVCIGQVPAACIKDIPSQINREWMNAQCQTKQFGYKDPSDSIGMIDKSEESLVGVRANGTLCVVGQYRDEHVRQGGEIVPVKAPEMVATLAQVRERLAPVIGA